MAEQLPNLDIFKSVSTVTHGVYGIESDYNTITSGKKEIVLINLIVTQKIGFQKIVKNKTQGI
jgi:hypothetical protein